MAIRLSGLHKSFGDVRAVRGIDLTLAPGEIVAFLGPNGAGKSTTIDMLLGLTTPDTGTVSLFGVDPHAAVVAGRVGAMLQAGAAAGRQVRELVKTFAGLHRHPMPVDQALEQAGITDIAGRLTQSLSGGQAQRFRFALALVPDPTWWCSTSPPWAWTSRSVDPSGIPCGASRPADARCCSRRTTSEADDFADRVVVIAEGAVVADGTGASIKAQVSGRTLSAVIPGADPAALAALAGVHAVEPVGGRFSLQCGDSDVALRAVLDRFPDVHDIEIHQADLEEAFLRLTAKTAEAPAARVATALKGL